MSQSASLPIIRKIPIASKIFGVAILMLVLLLAVAGINQINLEKLHHDLRDIAYYFVPLEKHLTHLSVHSLEQEILLEEVLQLHREKQPDRQAIQQKKQVFQENTNEIKEALVAIQQLEKEAIRNVQSLEKIVEFARLEPMLQIIEQDYFEFIRQANEVFKLLDDDKLDDALLVIERMPENNINERLQQVLIPFIDFIEQSALEAEHHEKAVLNWNIWLTAIATLIGIFIATVLIRQIIHPLQSLLQNTQQVTKGNLNVQNNIQSRDEIGSLAHTFDQMVAGMKQKEQLKAAFGQYVDPRIVQLLIQRKKDTMPVKDKQLATVFFSDIAGFSKISELLTAKGLVKLINQYLTLASEPILHNKGVIDKFIGDAVVAYWTTPFSDDDEHAVLACYSALQQFEQINTFRRMMPDLLGIRKGLPSFNVRMGIATSTVVTGHFGSHGSKSYTISGVATEIAEALETANKIYGTDILINEATKNAAEQYIEVRRIAKLMLPRTDSETNIYELIAKKGEAPEQSLQLADCFEQALSVLETQDLEAAKTLFQQCLTIKADDAPTLHYLNLIDSSKGIDQYG